jgi:hypothetical protein
MIDWVHDLPVGWLIVVAFAATFVLGAWTWPSRSAIPNH